MSTDEHATTLHTMPRQQQLRCKKQRGFNIIEVMVAAVVVAVGLLGAARFQARMIKTGVAVKDRTLALSAAQAKIELYRTDYEHLMNSGLPSYSDTPSIYTGSTGTLTRTWTINSLSAPNYDAINVNVGWLDSSGVTSNVALESYVAAGNPVMSSRQLLVQQTGYQTPPSPPQLPPSTPTSYNAIISGTIYQLSGNAAWTISASQAGQAVACDVVGNSYTCTMLGVPLANTTDITISFNPNDTPCGSSTAVVSLNATMPASTLDFFHAANVNQCP